jgi:hypothetical protein
MKQTYKYEAFLEIENDLDEKMSFLKKHNFNQERPIIVLLPGSCPAVKC